MTDATGLLIGFGAIAAIFLLMAAYSYDRRRSRRRSRGSDAGAVIYAPIIGVDGGASCGSDGGGSAGCDGGGGGS